MPIDTVGILKCQRTGTITRNPCQLGIVEQWFLEQKRGIIKVLLDDSFEIK